MQTISPIDGSVCAEYELASGAEIEAALDRAVRGQRRWKTVPVSERAATCRRAVELMVARADRLATELTWQMGRPITQSPFEIRRGFQERARYMIDIAEGALADEPPVDVALVPAVPGWIQTPTISCRGPCS